jgi:hypothetical protein
MYLRGRVVVACTVVYKSLQRLSCASCETTESSVPYVPMVARARPTSSTSSPNKGGMPPSVQFHPRPSIPLNPRARRCAICLGKACRCPKADDVSAPTGQPVVGPAGQDTPAPGGPTQPCISTRSGPSGPWAPWLGGQRQHGTAPDSLWCLAKRLGGPARTYYFWRVAPPSSCLCDV